MCDFLGWSSTKDASIINKKRLNSLREEKFFLNINSIQMSSDKAHFLFNRKQYETLSYATQSENKLPNIQKAYIIDMSSIK